MAEHVERLGTRGQIGLLDLPWELTLRILSKLPAAQR